MRVPRVAVIAVVTTGVVLGGAGIAMASIPDSGGVIHGCYHPQANGTNTPLGVIDTALSGGHCPSGDTEVSWNQAGPAGPQGPAGATGATGATGAQGPAGAPGPSTAGPSGLDLVIVQNDSGAPFAQAVCPADHPFITGGGAFIRSGTVSVESYPQQLTGEESASNPGAWNANSPSGLGAVVAEAICSK